VYPTSVPGHAYNGWLGADPDGAGKLVGAWSNDEDEGQDVLSQVVEAQKAVACRGTRREYFKREVGVWGATHSVNRNNLRHDAHTHIQMARVSNDIIIVRLHIHSHGGS